MRFKLEELLEITAVVVITLNTLAFSVSQTVYDRIHKAEEVKMYYFDPDAIRL